MKFEITKYQVVKELLGSKNFKSGGVGRVDCARVLARMTESDFLTCLRALGCKVWKIGTDFVVAAAGVEFLPLL